MDTGWSETEIRFILRSEGRDDLVVYLPRSYSEDQKISRNFPNFSDKQDTEKSAGVSTYADDPEMVLPDVQEGVERIILTRGAYTIVDKQDAEKVKGTAWWVRKAGKSFYATTKRIDSDKGSTVDMHRIILELSPGDGKIVDHINGNGLDNRRCNLRIVTTKVNNHNFRRTAEKTSKFKGVSYHKQDDYWVTCIRINGKPIRKYHRSELKAAACYDKLAADHYGELATTNLMLGRYTPEELAILATENS